MSESDYEIANQSFPNFRSDLNSVLAAIRSNNSNANAPTGNNKAAYQYWYDSTNDILKISNAANSGFISLFTFDQSGGTATPSTIEISADTSPQLGGNLDVNTKNIVFGDSASASDDRLTFGAGTDLSIYHHATNGSFIEDTGTGNLTIISSQLDILGTSETMAKFIDDGAVELYHNDEKKVETTANGITVTGTAIATTDTDTTNSGDVTLNFATKQNFVLTLTGAVTLKNPSTEQVGQSGFIAFIQDSTGGRNVSLEGDYEIAGGGSSLDLSSTAGATDLVPYVVIASNRILLGTPQKAFA
jgi:hypothetical protein|tara:strand:- start:1177 stop:2082 length:906 start_codon:yes stop_codon:yes gene_type:complete